MKLPEPVRLVGPPGVMRRLALHRESAIRLMHAGLAGRLYTDGQREMVELTRVEELGARPLKDLAELPPALLLRVGAPEPDTDPENNRGWKGWYQDAPREEQLAGVTRRWPVSHAEVLIGQLLVVSVSGFIVEVGRIESATQYSSDLTWAFVIRDADDAEAAAWRNIRTRQPGGGGVLRHGLD
jgi:hypothetical protein